MNIIIFSKNRPMQLDLLLRSIYENFGLNVKLKITYRHTSPEFESGYELVQRRFSGHNISWNLHSPYNFRIELIKLISPTDPLTLFFTDDSVMIRPFVLDETYYRFLSDKDAACFSMRLSPSVTYCFARDEVSRVPEIIDGRFKWQDADGDWGYPMSVEGHIFRTTDIYGKLLKFNYSNPCELEALLANDPIDKPYMYCGEKSSMINLPLNKVQTDWTNRCGSITPESLNEKYLQGYVIDYSPISNYENNACHHILPAVSFVLDKCTKK